MSRLIVPHADTTDIFQHIELTNNFERVPFKTTKYIAFTSTSYFFYLMPQSKPKNYVNIKISIKKLGKNIVFDHWILTFK